MSHDFVRVQSVAETWGCAEECLTGVRTEGPKLDGPVTVSGTAVPLHIYHFRLSAALISYKCAISSRPTRYGPPARLFYAVLAATASAKSAYIGIGAIV